MKKVLSILLCMVFLLSAVSCTVTKANKDGEDTKPQTETSDIAENTEKFPYEDIIAKYKELLSAKTKNKPLAEPNDSASEIEVALYEIVNDSTVPSLMGYATKDLNGDGTEELVLLSRSNKLYALFTLQNNTPVLLKKLDKISAVIMPSGTLYTRNYTKGKGSYTQVNNIIDGKLDVLEYGYVVDGQNAAFYKMENGIKTDITREEVDQFNDSIKRVTDFSPYSTKATGFRFVSAVPKLSPSTAPVPDFSSYDGIISAYKTIVNSFSDYETYDWIEGDFDSIFTITDNDTYDIFHRIFWRGIQVRPTETYFGQDYASDGDNSYGYAKKDLNGDGIEELILLRDNYKIFALFTMKNGKALFVDGVLGTWIDGNGRIYKELATGGLVDRDGEAFVYEFDGEKLRCVIGVGYRVNIYLKKEGWYKIEGDTKTEISAQEGEALYAEFDVIPSRYNIEEYTRTFSGIKFIPLFKSTLAGQKHIKTFSKGLFTGNTLTVSEFSDNDVTATVKFVYTESEFDPETNPDPEVHTIELNIQAIRNGNRYEFEKDGIKGYIECIVSAVWFVVTESENEHVPSRAYLFDYPED